MKHLENGKYTDAAVDICLNPGEVVINATDGGRVWGALLNKGFVQEADGRFVWKGPYGSQALFLDAIKARIVRSLYTNVEFPNPYNIDWNDLYAIWNKIPDNCPNCDNCEYSNGDCDCAFGGSSDDDDDGY